MAKNQKKYHAIGKTPEGSRGAIYTFKGFEYVSKSDYDKMMKSCHKLEVKYNKLVQYSAKQCSDLVNSISKKKYNVLKCNFKLLNETNATLLIENDKLKEENDNVKKYLYSYGIQYNDKTEKIELDCIPKEGEKK